MAEEIGKATSETATGDTGKEGTTSVEHWGKVCPRLEEALGLYDKRDSDSAPDWRKPKQFTPAIAHELSQNHWHAQLQVGYMRRFWVSNARQPRKNSSCPKRKDYGC